MLVTMIPSFSFADETGSAASSAGSGTAIAATSGNCGATGHESDVTWSFDESSGTLTISGTGAMADYVSASADGNHIPWGAYKDNVKSIVVKSGVTRVGSRSFDSFSNLDNVTIGNDVTVIGDRAFQKTSVDSVILPSSVKEVEDAAFWHCEKLTSIDLSHVKKIGKNSFDGCAELKTVDLDALTSMGNLAFQDCKKLATVNLGNNISELPTAFKKCSELKSIDLPDSVTEIGGECFSETGLESIDLNNVTTIKSTGAFLNCKNLRSIEMSNLTGTLLRKTFQGCSGLQKISIPSGITSIESAAFSDCRTLEEIMIESGTSNLKIEEQQTLSGLRNLKIDRNIETTNAGGFKTWSSEGLNLVFEDHVTSVPANLVMGDSTVGRVVNKIVFGKNVKKVNSNAFRGNNSIKMVDMTSLEQAPTSMDLRAMISGSVIYVSSKNMADTLNGTNNAEGQNYAKWKTGVAVLNGGKLPKNSTVELTKLIVPEKENSIFAGWYSDAELTKPVAENTMTSVSSDYGRYYARWEDKKDRTISVNPIKDKVYDTHRIELDKSNCTVEGTGNITFSYEQKVGDDWVKLDGAPVYAGTYRVKATIAEDDTYKSATSDDYVTFNINKADQKLSYNTANIEKHAGDVVFTNLLTETTVDGKLTYASSNEKVATVNEKTGEVTIVGAGEATITATAATTPNYNKATASYELTVTQHVFSEDWEPGVDGHWHKCTVDGCDVKSDFAEHKFQWVVDKEATTTEKGSKHEKCTVCGYKEAAVEIPVIENGTTGGDQNSGNAGNSTKADTANGSKTGDTMPIGMLAVLMLAAAAGIAFCGRKLYKSR